MDQKLRRVFLLLLAVLLSLCLFALAACDGDAGTEVEQDPTIVETTTFTVTVFDGNTVYTKQVRETEEITVVAEDLDDKVFAGWSVEGRIVSKDKSYTFTVGDDAAVNAVYKDVYTLYLFAGEGTVSTPSVTVVSGEKYTLPVPTREHHEFVGWYDGVRQYTDDKGKSLAPLDTDGDVNLTAKYIAIPTFTVKVDDGVETTETSYYRGEEVTVSAATLSDRRCDGWYHTVVATGDNGETSENEERLSAETTYTFVVTEDVFLYAKYHVSYKVTVIGGSGSGDYLPGQECTIRYRAIEWQEFRYWMNYTTKEPLKDDNDDDVTTESYTFVVTESVMIQAAYNKKTYTVSYLVDGEPFGDPDVLHFNDEIPSRIYTPAVHYVFSGWSDIPVKMPARDLVITGSTRLQTHRVLVEDGYGAGVYDWGTEITITAADKSSEGKRHVGWTVNGVDYDGVDAQGKMIVTRDISLRAKYADMDYNLVYYIYGADYGEEGHAIFDEDKFVNKVAAVDFPTTLRYGEEIPVLDSPEREHYDFSGWSTIPATMPARDITIYATFQVHHHTLRVIDGYINGDEDLTEAIFAWGEEVTINPVLNTGYKFSSWNHGSAKVYTQEGDGTYTFAMVGYPNDPNKNGYTYELTAKTVLEDYYIYYYLDGDPYESSILAHYDDPVSLKSNPSREHYTFSGWHLDSGEDVPARMPAGDLYVYGTFGINRYTLTIGQTESYYGTRYYYGYFNNDEDCHSVTVDYGSTVRITATDLSAIGKDFTRWQYTFRGRQTTASEVASFDFTLNVDGDLPFEAPFVDHQYRATYYLKSPHDVDYTQVAQRTFKYNSYYELWDGVTDTNHIHHVWSGWYENPDDQREQSDEVIVDIDGMPARDLDFYSECVFVLHDLDVAVNDVDGEYSGYMNVADEVSGQYEWSQVLTLCAVRPTGYDFDHWTFNGNTLHESDNFHLVSSATGEATLTVTGDGTLKAFFVKSRYSVTVEKGKIIRENGSPVSATSGTYEYQTELTIEYDGDQLPAGYEFDYWQKDGEYYSDSETIENFSVFGNVAFTAVWKNIKYEITYYCKNVSTGEYELVDFDDEQYPNPVTDLVIGQQVDRYPDMPVVAHYTFSGWKYGRTGDQGNVPLVIEMGASGKDIYGWYIPDRHVVNVVGGTASPAAGQDGKYAYPDEITVTATVPTGKHFVRWENGNGESVSTDAEYTFAVKDHVVNTGDEVTLTAIVEWTDYTITYKLDGATYSDYTYKTVENMHYGDVFPTEPDPAAIDFYGFAGWTYNDSDLPETMPVSDVVVVGRYIDLYDYELDDETYLIVAATDAKALFPASPVLPTERNGLPVVGLSENALYGVSGVTSLTVPASYAYIGDGAFRGLNLTSVTLSVLPSDGKFYSLFTGVANAVPASLKTVVFGGATVPNGCFAGVTVLESITINAATSIGDEAFSGCTGLTTLVLSSTGLTSIGTDAFRNVTALTSIEYDAINVSSVAEGTFYAAGTLGAGITLTVGSAVEKLPDNFFYNGAGGVSGNVPKLVSVVFGASMPDEIGQNAFRRVFSLTGELDLTGCETVGQYAFYGSGLTDLTLPAGVSTGVYAFANMTSLADLSVGSFAEHLFDGSGDDLSVTILSTVTEIPERAFASATIDSITFAGNALTTLGVESFMNATIGSVVLPEGLTTIGSYAFYSSTLTSVVIPETTQSIGSSAFASCGNLTSVTYKAVCADDLTASSNVFAGSGDTVFAVTVTTSVRYLPAYLFYSVNGDVYATSVTIADNGDLTEIGAYAFADLYLLSALYLGNTVMTIGEKAFFQIGAEEVVLPYRAYYIGSKAFGSAADLTIKCQVSEARATWANDWAQGVHEVVYDYGKVVSGDYAYVLGGNRAYLTAYSGAGGDVVVPDQMDIYDVYDIGTIFKNNTDLTSIVLPTTVNEFFDGAFYGCSELTSVTGATGHEGVVYLAPYAFYGAEKLATFGLTILTEEIGESAFEGCEALTSFDTSGLVTIGQNAFKNAGLTSVTLSRYLESLGADAFFGCPIGSYALGSGSDDPIRYNVASGSVVDLNNDVLLYYPVASATTNYTLPSVSEIAPYAFRNANNLTALTIPATVTTIGSYAFAGCGNLTDITYLATAADALTSSDKPFDGAGKDGAGAAVTIGAAVSSVPAYLFFGDNVKLTSITFATGAVVESIGAYAFYNNHFTSIVLPASLTTLGDKCFYSSTATAITLNGDLNDLASSSEVFGPTGGATVTVGADVTRVPSYAFYRSAGSDVSALDLSAADGLVIGAYAFAYTSLTTLTLTAGVSDVENYAFAYIDTLSSVTVLSSEDFSGQNIFCDSGRPVLGMGVTINTENVSDNLFYATTPPTVKTITFTGTAPQRIGENAFRDLTLVTALTLPTGVEIIEEYAFYGDTGIATLTIPTTVETIRPFAFAYLDGMTALYYNAINASGNYSGQESVGFNADGNVFACSLDAADLTVYIGDEVEEIPGFMFYAMVTDGTRPTLCTDAYASVNPGAKTTVLSCDCNPFMTVLANTGSTAGLAEHGSVSQISYATTAALNALSNDFDAFLTQYNTDGTGWIDDYEVVVGERATALFALSEDETARSIEIKEKNTAVIGVNSVYNVNRNHYLAVQNPVAIDLGTYYEYNSTTKEYALTEDGEIALNKTYYRVASYDDYLTAIAKLFGYADKNVFIDYADSIATLYRTNAEGATATTARGRLTYDGAVLTETGDYILPYSFTTSAPVTNVLAFVVVNTDGVVSVWISDVDKMFSASNVGEKIIVTVTAKGRCGLFDLNCGQTRVTAVNFPLTTNLTTIGDYAFAYLTNATFSTIPSSVNTVSDYAFYECEGIKTLTMRAPQGIGDSSFMRSGLTTLSFTDCSDAFDIGSSAFEGCAKLATVTFDCDGLAITIGDAAFKDDISLVSLTSIPDETASIGAYAFAGCTSLTTVNLGETITEIADGLFKDCVSLTTFSIPATVESIGDSAFERCVSFVSDLVVNVPVGEKAFFMCTGLTSVTLGDDVTSVGDYAFFRATGVTSVVIGEGLASIGDAAFYGLTSLASITYNAVGEENGVAGTFVFADDDYHAVSLTIGAKVEYIPNNLFSGSNVSAINFAARPVVDTPSLTIGESAFKNTRIAAVDLPEYVVEVGDYAFSGCTYATTLRLGGGLNKIGYRAFEDMTHVTTLYHDAYQLADNNFSVFATSGWDKRNSNVFLRLGRSGLGVTVYVDAAVTKIHSNMFYVTEYNDLSTDTPNLTSVVFASGSVCDTIGAYAFCNNVSLTTITGLTDVTSIGANAFLATAITSVPCESSLVSIGDSAFKNCAGLTAITLGSHLTQLGDSAFAGCVNVTDLTINTDKISVSNASWIAGGGTASGGMDVVFGKIDKIPDNIFYRPSDSSMTAPVVNSVTCVGYIAEVIYTRASTGTRTIWIDGTKYEAYDYYCREVKRPLVVGDNAFYGVSVGTFDFSGRSIGVVGDNAFRGASASIAMTLFNWSLDSDEPALYYAFRPTDLRYLDNGSTSIQDVVYLHDGTVGEDFFREMLPQLVVEDCSIGAYAFDGVENVQLTMYRPKSYNIDEPICDPAPEGGYRIETNPDFSKLVVGEYAFRNSTNDYVNYGVQFVVPDASVNYRAFGADLIVSAGDYAFYGCGRINGSSAFTGVFENLTGDGIGDYAFAKTKIDGVQFGSTTSRLMGDGDYSFGVGMFDDTTWYENASDGVLYISGHFRYQIGESDYDDEDYPYYYAYGYKGAMPSDTTLTFMSGTKRIPAMMIADEENLVGVVIPDSVDLIDSNAFFHCINLVTITAPLWAAQKIVTTTIHSITITAVDSERVNGTTITYRMFYNCHSLTTVNLCDGITTIGEEAFRACGHLTDITLPSSVTTIESKAFYIVGGETPLTIRVSFIEADNEHDYLIPVVIGTDPVTGDPIFETDPVTGEVVFVIDPDTGDPLVVSIADDWISDGTIVDYVELPSAA